MILGAIHTGKENSYLRRAISAFLLAFFFFACVVASHPVALAAPQAPPPDRSWVAKSNAYTQLLLDVQNRHSPESASAEGLAAFDDKISQPTKLDDDAQIAETKAVQRKLMRALAVEPDKNVRQDLQILLHSIQITLQQYDYAQAHKVPFENASEDVFQGLRGLLDDQVAPERRKAALVRLREYAGLAPGYTKPFTEILEQRAEEQMAEPNMVFPSKVKIETELARNENYIQGIPTLFKKYGLTGWEEPFAKLQTQLTGYDAWIRATILPKARADFRLPHQEYALDLEGYGIDIPIAQLEQLAHHEFQVYQGQMQAIAMQIAAQRQWRVTDYRDVVRRLRQDQIKGDDVLPFYKKRLAQIEAIIVKHNLVTLPDRPARIRLATPAESAEEPAPHMAPPPMLHNTGEQGELVLPLNMPPTKGEKTEKIDDFTSDAASWTVIAHEARPGHELQFDSMVEHGVSEARALYAFNSTNVEGWGLYSEYIMKPYMPLDGQLISLQFRMARAARAFLDPELQSGKITPKDAMRVLTEDVVLSEPFAKTEVERYTYRAPGQATSYFYGFTRLLQLRRETESALGKKFDQKKFHDFILAQGLLPPNLMRQAVLTDFIPSQQAN
jgi:Bacterial protein of unknown function (DUF885)